MRKDIEIPVVKDIAVAVVSEESIWKKNDWYVYMVNLGNEVLKNILVVSRGYGEINNEKINTSTLRQHFDELGPKEFLKIEPIMEEVFGVTNEYWISYYIGDKIFDKQYIFLPETIKKEHFTKIPLVNKPGVMIK
jgi:hypothetical protein